MGRILDAYGRPVEQGALTKEIATPDIMGVRQVLFDTVAAGLTPERLAAIMSAVDQGDIEEYLSLADQMEERDPHYRSVIGTRKLAVSGLDVVVESVTNDAKDVEIADFVREVLEAGQSGDLFSDLLDGIGKGFSVCEIMWDRSGSLWEPREYKHRDSRHFQFDHDTQSELRLRDISDPVNGLALAPYKFITHRPKLKTGLTIRAGLARLVAVAYMCKSYNWKDWMAFAEVFGMPIRVGKYPSSSTKDQRASLLASVASIGTDAACIIPQEMMVEFIEAKNNTGSQIVFEVFADWLDDQVSEGVLGQRASTKGTPGALGAQDSQENVREDIRKSDAKQLATTLFRDLVKPLVDLNYGPRPNRKYARIRIGNEEPEDLVAFSNAVSPLIDRGLPVEVSVVLDKFGLEMPAEGAKLLGKKEVAPPFGPPGGAPIPGEQTTEEETPDDQEPETPKPDEDPEQPSLQHSTKLVLEKLRYAMAMASRTTPDEIDKLVDKALGGWQRVMSPMLDPIAKLAAESPDAKAFQEGLEKLLGTLSQDELVRTIALATFEARGLGDSRDRP